MERINNNKYSYAFAVYNIDNDMLLAAYKKDMNIYDKLALNGYIKSGLNKNNLYLNSLWSCAKVNDKMIFFKGYYFSGNIIVAFIDANTLMSFVNKTDNSIQEQIVLTDKDGNALGKSANIDFSNIEYPLSNARHEVTDYQNQYIMISSDIELTNARLSVIIREKNIFLGLNYVQWIIAVLGFTSVLLMMYFISYLNREIIKPVKALIHGIQEIEKGNLDYEVEGTGNLLEFQTLNNSFNSMIKEIKTLKISYYEKRIQLQKAELKYLYMQIRPHFFLNALTTIHSLSFKDRNEEIRKFLDALSNHLRYMFKGGFIKVKINEEIEYVRNYFYMQEIRFPGSVFYVFDVEPSVGNEVIPQFLIHTFVENSFKHAMNLEGTLSIFIKIKSCVFNGNDAVKIEIEDSGEGFPEDVIGEVNNMNVTDVSDGYKIGISNIKRTLSIFYGQNALLKISNEESMGAKVEIIIPVERGNIIENINS